MANEPIDPQEYYAGVKVVDIGDLRVARGKTRRPYESCKHMNLAYDQTERRIFCRDCEKDVDPFDAFTGLCGVWDAAARKLSRQKEDLEEAKTFSVRSLAAKALDKAWRRRTMVPACPHCHQGLLPEDFKDGVKSSVSAEWTRAQRNKGK